VRNYCSPCRRAASGVAATTHPAAHPRAGAATPGAATLVSDAPLVARRKSPWLAATLSIVPGLGQAYAGRVLRGAGCFGASLLLRDAPFMSALLSAFLYVYGMFDAFRCAEARDPDAVSVTKGRVDDLLFLLAGLVVLAATLVGHGGLAAAPRELLLPIGAIGAGLLFAHESRR
jgi:hypothetical protein